MRVEYGPAYDCEQNDIESLYDVTALLVDTPKANNTLNLNENNLQNRQRTCMVKSSVVEIGYVSVCLKYIIGISIKQQLLTALDIDKAMYGYDMDKTKKESNIIKYTKVKFHIRGLEEDTNQKWQHWASSRRPIISHNQRQFRARQRNERLQYVRNRLISLWRFHKYCMLNKKIKGYFHLPLFLKTRRNVSYLSWALFSRKGFSTIVISNFNAIFDLIDKFNVAMRDMDSSQI